MSESNPTSTGTVNQANQPDSGEEKTVSQTQLDKIVGERLARQKATLQKEFELTWASRFSSQLAEMGINPEELDTLKASKEKVKESSGEIGKLKSEQAALKKQIDDLKKYQDLWTGEKVRGTVESISEKVGKSTKSQALTLSKLIGDSLKYQDGQVVVLDDNGEPDYTKSVEDIIKQKLEEYPFLKGPGLGGGSGGKVSGGTSATGEADLKTSEGRIAHLQKVLSG